MKANRYSSSLADDGLFFFKSDRLGDGTEKDHTHIMVIKIKRGLKKVVGIGIEDS
jgi:hypothetical protein